jgi:hypothetical protein
MTINQWIKKARKLADDGIGLYDDNNEELSHRITSVSADIDNALGELEYDGLIKPRNYLIKPRK